VREGKRLPPREYDDFRVRVGVPTAEDVKQHCGEDGQIICARNATRQHYNRRARKLLGFSGDLPQIGEKIVCLFNQHSHNFMNGEQGIVLNYFSKPEYEWGDNDLDGDMIRIRSLTDGKERSVKFNKDSFSSDYETRAEAARTVGGFDFGYALTTHKSQGSEWDNVLIIEEALPSGDYAELMYTGITRAIKRVTLYREN